MKLHVNRFGVFGSYCAGSEANSAHALAEYFSRGLGISNAMQNIAESDALFSIDEHCGIFGLSNGGDDNGNNGTESEAWAVDGGWSVVVSKVKYAASN